MEPHLFDEAVDTQLSRLSADAEAADAEAKAAPSATTDLTLYKRIEDVKRRQRSQAVQARAVRGPPARSAAPPRKNAVEVWAEALADAALRAQDLMYFSIMRKFADIGVDMLPPLVRCAAAPRCARGIAPRVTRLTCSPAGRRRA